MSLKHSGKKQLLIAECSGSGFKRLDKPIEEYITEQENKNTRTKTQRAVKLLTAFLLEKNEQRKIEGKEKMATTMNHQAFEGCFQVSTGI